MTEQELRENIIGALEKGGRNFLKSKATKVSIYEYYADALIAAGIGDVSEYECKIPPAMVGDTVWYVDRWSAKKYKGKVSMIQCKADKTWRLRITYVYYVSRTKGGLENECTHTIDLHWDDKIKDVCLFIGENAEEKSENKVKEMLKQAEKELQEENKDVR